MALTHNRVNVVTVEEIVENGYNDLVVLDDGETYSSADGALHVFNGKVYDLLQIINFFFDNADADMLEGIRVQTLEE